LRAYAAPRANEGSDDAAGAPYDEIRRGLAQNARRAIEPMHGMRWRAGERRDDATEGAQNSAFLVANRAASRPITGRRQCPSAASLEERTLERLSLGE